MTDDFDLTRLYPQRLDSQGRIDELAKWNAHWGTCPRTKVGAVIHVGEYVLASGRNGSPPGEPHCTEVGCIMERSVIQFGPLGLPVYSPDTGEPMTEEHCRRANHAELNALAQAAAHGTAVRGASLTVTHTPCRICRGVLAVAGIADIRVLFTHRNSLPRQYDTLEI